MTLFRYADGRTVDVAGVDESRAIWVLPKYVPNTYIIREVHFRRRECGHPGGRRWVEFHELCELKG